MQKQLLVIVHTCFQMGSHQYANLGKLVRSFTTESGLHCQPPTIHLHTNFQHERSHAAGDIEGNIYEAHIQTDRQTDKHTP